MATSPASHLLQLMDGGANMHQAVSVLEGKMQSCIMGSADLFISPPLF